MKQLILGVILTTAPVATTLPASGQVPPAPNAPAKPKADGPQIRFSETVFDFGKIRSSEMPMHTFYATNVGNAVLEITAVTPGCGCTTAGEWDRKIQPGQAGKIPIQFNPAKFSGRITNKYVSITCNDSTHPSHTLYLQATIWRPIDVQPSLVYFTPIESEPTNETKTVRITTDLPESVTLEPPQCANPAFKLGLKTLQPGKEFELSVAYDPPASNAVPSGQITIKTSTTNMPLLEITAYAMVQPALMAMPNQVRLPVATSPVGYRHSALIRNNGSAPVKLTEPAVNAQGVTVEVVETQPGKLFTLNMDIPPNFQVRPGLELTAKTTHPKYPVFHVPIIAPVAQAPVVVPPPTPATGPK
jgi:hypothetical protein